MPTASERVQGLVQATRSPLHKVALDTNCVQYYGFVFASLTHERARQNQPGFASKSDLQKDEDAWNDYLSLWKIFGVCLDLPQTTWFLCENASTRCLNADETRNFLTQAKNVL